MGIGYLSFILTMVYKKKFRFTNLNSCVVVVRRSVKEQRGPMRFFIILSPIPRPSCVVLRPRLGDLGHYTSITAMIGNLMLLGAWLGAPLGAGWCCPAKHFLPSFPHLGY